MVDSIKITALQDIGANIAYTTLVPVVNMAGVPTTQKSNLQNLGNLILNGAGGSYFPRAAQATLALSVANAAQPNITSVGTLGSLAVTGNITAGNINGGNIVVANFYYGDGGFLTNVATGSNYSNNDVANYLPTYTGVVGANRIASNTLSGSNVEINANGASFIFGEGGALYWPAGPDLRVIETNIDGEFEIKSTTNVVISTDISNANLHFTFASDGVVYCPANANFEGTRLNVGPGAGNVNLATNPTLVVTDNGGEFIQTAILNENSNGSSDYAAYGADSDETQGFADLGFSGHTFNDPNYTITNPGDAYVLGQGYANGIGGALVLATGENGNVPDIVFATGGFLANAEFARISHTNNALELNRTGSSITFFDGTELGQIEGANTFGFYSNDANMQFLLEAASNNWVFDGANSNFTTPSNLVIGANVAGGSSIYQLDAPLQVIGEGANSAMIVGWTANSSGPEDVVAIAFNNPLANGASNLVMGVGNNSTTVNYWTFANDGTTTFPTLTVDLHNGGNQTAQTLQFGDNTQQAIITGPTPAVDTNAERLIIQGQRASGTGEGGDVYFWAGDADLYGGDIKIYAGDADNVSTGYGGYVNIEGGRGFDQGGYVRMTAGQSSNGQGAYAQIVGGYGVSGGDANITGGYGTAGPGGNINLNAGQSGNGLAEYGIVNISAGASTWSFDNSGNLTIPNAIIGSGNLLLVPDSTNSSAYLNVYLTTGPDIHIAGNGETVILGTDDFANVAVNVNGNVTIQASTGTPYAWTFGSDGNLTLPGNTVAINFANGSAAFANLVQWTTAPTANTDPGSAGQAAYDAGGNLYVCVTTNTWAKFSGTTSW